MEVPQQSRGKWPREIDSARFPRDPYFLPRQGRCRLRENTVSYSRGDTIAGLNGRIARESHEQTRESKAASCGGTLS